MRQSLRFYARDTGVTGSPKRGVFFLELHIHFGDVFVESCLFFDTVVEVDVVNICKLFIVLHLFSYGVFYISKSVYSH